MMDLLINVSETLTSSSSDDFEDIALRINPKKRHLLQKKPKSSSSTSSQSQTLTTDFSQASSTSSLKEEETKKKRPFVNKRKSADQKKLKAIDDHDESSSDEEDKKVSIKPMKKKTFITDKPVDESEDNGIFSGECFVNNKPKSKEQHTAEAQEEVLTESSSSPDPKPEQVSTMLKESTTKSPSKPATIIPSNRKSPIIEKSSPKNSQIPLNPHTVNTFQSPKRNNPSSPVNCKSQAKKFIIPIQKPSSQLIPPAEIDTIPIATSAKTYTNISGNKDVPKKLGLSKNSKFKSLLFTKKT